jgi:fumarylacetoacetase
MMPALDATHDTKRRSWVAAANDPGTDFPIQNLPVGVFVPLEGGARGGIAIGDMILDVGAALERGWFDGPAADAALAMGEDTLNTLMGLGPVASRALRRQVSDLLDADGPRRREVEAQATALLHPMADCAMQLPILVQNYTDFYAGIHHARAAGALMRPGDPLSPNYKHLPVAYHGRASSVCVSGAVVRRPWGQYLGADGVPVFGQCERLDLELEMGFLVGTSNARGMPVPIAEAGAHLFGAVLLNDWSARDIQRWEMTPLGPFLGKNFGTSISPWVVTMDALAPYRCPAMERPDGDPAPLPYLTDAQDQRCGGFDIGLSVSLQTERMRADGQEAETIIRSNSRYLYWTPAQMVAHHTCGGCNLQSGDLIGSGTISGPTREELSSMMELTRAGQDPWALANGERRGFLADGDEVSFAARCTRDGFAAIGFGTCSGRIVPAEPFGQA